MLNIYTSPPSLLAMGTGVRLSEVAAGWTGESLVLKLPASGSGSPVWMYRKQSV